MSDHHPTLAPSSLPMLEQCPCFERAEDAAAMSLEPRPKSGTVYRDRGTLMHKAFEQLLRGHTLPKESIVMGGSALTPTEREQVQWAADYVKANASGMYPLEIEQELVLMDDKFNIVTYGTGDVINGPRIFDLKTGDYHNYWLQTACYGLMQMDRIGVDRVDVSVMFSRHKNIHTQDVFREEAEKRINAVVAAVLDPDRKPRANPYCRWCKKVMTCEAVKRLVDGTNHDLYEINEPNELSDALKRAKILKEWVERIEYHAKNAAMAGLEIPYFYLKSRQGARQIMDVRKAYELSGIPAEQFLTLCSIPVGAVEDSIATLESVSKSAAKKLVNERLCSVMQRRAPTVYLAPTKNEDEITEK